ncbi:MAG: AsmA family protein [Fulvimonas sp.]|nr:AsmA family protein [Fulvimonas sp.]
MAPVSTRRWPRWLMRIALALLALVLLVIVAIVLFDWNRLRPFINDKLSQALGRPFAIAGDLTVDWSREREAGGLAAWVPWPTFTARDVRIGNPAWAKQTQFAHLDAVRFRLALLPLLAHRIVVPLVQLQRPAVDLERDAQGRASWDFALADDGQPSAWKLELDRIGFDRGTAHVDDAPGRIVLDIDVQPLTGPIPYERLVSQASEEARADASAAVGVDARRAMAGKAPRDERIGHAGARDLSYRFAWHARGTYHGAPAQGSGRIGGLIALREAREPFPLQARMHIGDSRIALVGTLTDPLHLAALDLRVWFAGSSMARLYAITGVTLPDTPPFATEGHLVAQLRRGGSHYAYHDFRGRVGGSDLAGDLNYDTGGARPKLSGTLRSQVLRMADLAPLIGVNTGASSQDGSGTAATPQPADKVLPAEPFRTDRWQAMDADVRYSGAHLLHDDDAFPLDSLDTHLTLRAGVLTLDPLKAGLADGTVQGKLRLDGSREPMRGSLDLTGSHLKLKRLFPGFAPMQTSLGEINGQVTLEARGNSVAGLLGSADGAVRMVMNDGAISRNLLEMAGLNVGNIILGKLFGDRTVKIRCAATDLEARHGLFTTRLFVFDTEDALIEVEGSVDFANERLNFDIYPHTKGVRVLSLRSPLYARGTFKHPDVGVHGGPLLARGAGAAALGAAVAPAAALLALIAPSHDDEADACRDVLQLRRPATL